MAVRIVTDSAADLPPQLAESLGIIRVPIRVNIGGASFRDGIDFPSQSFTTKIEAGLFPSTSQPSPWDFRGVFTEFLPEEVFCLTLSEALSGTYQSATIAAQQVGGSIQVMDTKLVSAAQGLLVMRVAQAAQRMNLDELPKMAEAEAKDIKGYAVLDNVEPIVRGGRTSLFARHAADREGIKLIFTLNRQGGIQILERVRGRKSSLDRLAEVLVEKNCSQVAVAHVDCHQEAAMVARGIHERSGAEIVYIQGAGGAVRTYAGRGAIIVAG